MSNNVVQGKVIRADLANTRTSTNTNDLLTKVARYAGKARVIIVQHGHRIETDPAYREAWERLVNVLSEKNGPIGNNASLADAIQAFLAKAL